MSIKLGVKKGLLTPTLPKHVMDVNDSVLVRVFRVLGGLCTLFLLGSRHLNMSMIELIVVMLIGVLYLIYGIVIICIRIRYMWRAIMDGELNIKNTPTDKLGSIIGKAIWCIKGACTGVTFVGTVVGIGLTIDGGLRSVGRETIMEKNMGLLINKILPVSKDQYNSYLETIYSLEVEEVDYKKKLNKAIGENREEYINLWKEKIMENNLKRDYYRRELIEIRNKLNRK